MQTKLPSSQNDPSVGDWLSLVQRKVNDLAFGVVTIVVHDSVVTQVESTEKVRLEHKKNSPAPKNR